MQVRWEVTYVQTGATLQCPFSPRPERRVLSWGTLDGIEPVRESPRPQAQPSTSPDSPYQSLGTRFVLSTYSPHIQASPPITRAFCSGLPEGKQATTGLYRLPNVAHSSDRSFCLLTCNVQPRISCLPPCTPFSRLWQQGELPVYLQMPVAPPCRYSSSQGHKLCGSGTRGQRAGPGSRHW